MQHLLVDIEKGIELIMEIRTESDMKEAKSMAGGTLMIVQYPSIEEGVKMISDFNNKISVPKKTKAKIKQSKSVMVASTVERNIKDWSQLEMKNLSSGSWSKLISNVIDEKWNEAFAFCRNMKLGGASYCCDWYRGYIVKNILKASDSKIVSIDSEVISKLEGYV